MMAVPIWWRIVYRGARDDYCPGGVAAGAVVANMLVGEVAACDCHCDYCQYDCRY